MKIDMDDVVKSYLKADLSSPLKKIGKNSFHGIIDDYFHAQVEIGNFTSIAPPLYVHGATEHPCVFNKNYVSTFPFGDKGWDENYPKTQSKGKIEIGSDVWIGESVTLLSGVKIRDGAIIGARAIVAKEIPPFAIAVGNPARVIRYRFAQDVIEKLLKIKWWEWTEEKIKENLELMKNVDKFVEKFE